MHQKMVQFIIDQDTPCMAYFHSQYSITRSVCKRHRPQPPSRSSRSRRSKASCFWNPASRSFFSCKLLHSIVPLGEEGTKFCKLTLVMDVHVCNICDIPCHTPSTVPLAITIHNYFILFPFLYCRYIQPGSIQDSILSPAHSVDRDGLM